MKKNFMDFLFMLTLMFFSKIVLKTNNIALFIIVTGILYYYAIKHVINTSRILYRLNFTFPIQEISEVKLKFILVNLFIIFNFIAAVGLIFLVIIYRFDFIKTIFS